MTPTTSPRAHRALATRVFDPRPDCQPRTKQKAGGIRTHDLLPKVSGIRLALATRVFDPRPYRQTRTDYYGLPRAKFSTSFCHETLAEYSHLPRHDHARFFRAFFNEIFLGQYYWLEHGDFTFSPYGVRTQDIYCRYVSNSVILIFFSKFRAKFILSTGSIF